MEWYETPESGTVARIRYEVETATLEVEFKNSTCYQYFDVPEAVYVEFCQAASKGQFLNHHIRGSFRYARC